MNQSNRLFGVLFSTGLVFASCPVWADPAPAMPAAQKAQPMGASSSGDNWYANASVDYYSYRDDYNANNTININSTPSTATGSKQGDLYGATLDLAPPGLYRDGDLRGLIELSFHNGKLNGDVQYASATGHGTTIIKSEWTEVSLAFKAYPYQGKWQFINLGIGLQYDRWNATETFTAAGGFHFFKNGLDVGPTRTVVDQAATLRLSGEYGVYFVNQTFDNESQIKLGVRGQGFGGIGVDFQNDSISSNNNTDNNFFIYNVGLRGTGFVDFTIPISASHLFSVFAEGGWLYEYWGTYRKYNTGNTTSATDSIYGPYARAGIKISF